MMNFFKGCILFSLFIFITSCASDDGGGPIPDPPDPVVVEPHIEWDQSTKTRISSSMAQYNGYARLIELQNGNLLVAYESNGRIVTKISTDQGLSWGIGNVVVMSANGVNMATPDLIQLSNGTIIIAYNPRPTDASNEHFTIRTIMSTDNGATWGNDQELYQAGTDFENGCWEPSLIQLPNGEVQLFFSNEGIYTTSSEQNISLLRSNDNGQTWSSTPEIVSFRSGKRDGMPKPIYLPNINSIVFSIEDNGVGKFKPYTIRNTLTENWQTTVSGSSSNRNSALSEPLSNTVYAGAPYMAVLSSGEVLLSYQSTENRSTHTVENSEMIVAIGDNEAKNFTNKSKPFIIPNGRLGNWNSIAVLNDDTIIALTSTNTFSNGPVEVWMIKGKYIRE